MSKKREEDVQPFMFAGKEAADEATRAVLSNRTLIFLSGLFILLALLSFWGYVRLSQNITVKVVMPGYEEMIVGQDSANDEYFKIWGNALVRYASNFDQDNVEERIYQATKLFKRSKYLEEKHKFENFVESVKANRIRQEFRPYEGKNEWGIKRISRSHVEYFQKGMATQFVGRGTPIQKECSYKIVLYVEGGQVYEDAFSTDCFAAN